MLTQKLKLEELGRINIEVFKKTKKNPIVVILDNVRSMHNVGSVFRTSDAFLVEKIFLVGITPQPPHREIQKAALGATESVDWEQRTNLKSLLTELKTLNYKIIGVEQTNNSQMISDFRVELNEKIALIFGNEVEGISDEILNDIDCFIELPQYGTKHSLNVSVCAGIVIWEMMNKQKDS